MYDALLSTVIRFGFVFLVVQALFGFYFPNAYKPLCCLDLDVIEFGLHSPKLGPFPLFSDDCLL